MSPKIKIKPVTEENLPKKFAISYIFMSLVPIVLLVLVIHFMGIAPLLQKHIPYFNLTLLLILLLSMACFDLVRRSMNVLAQFTGRAKEIADGDYHKRLEVKEKDEIGMLASSFNKITLELQVKIKELELSKALLQDVLQRIGTAVTSTRGIESLLELIIQSLVKGLDATSGAIFLLDKTQDQLIMRVCFGLDKDLEKIKVRCDEGLIGRVVTSKKPGNISDVSRNAACDFEYNNKLAKDSIMAAPLLYKDEILGVIIISDKMTKNFFSNDDIILLVNVAAQTAIAIKNFQLNEDAEKTYLETITALAVAVEVKDPYSRGHLDRVRDYVERLGRKLELDNETMKVLRSGAILHDIGKIGIRDEILKKEGPLTNEEEKEMRQHVIIGVNIIKPIRSMSALCDLVRHHHEFYDGSGYPDGLKGEKIPLVARILKVCDAYDAMTTDRPYNKAMNKEETKQELKRKNGIEFDPKIVEAFTQII